MGTKSTLSVGLLAVFIAPVTPALADDPDTIQITALVRDFVERTEPEGHPDFERNKAIGAGGIHIGVVAPTLDPNRKMVFVSKGTKLTKISSGVFDQWTDSAGRPICHLLYDPAPPWNDNAGSLTPNPPSGFTSGTNFDMWYRDVPGVNLSTAVTLTLVLQADGTYVFDDKDDPLYSTRGGFFPIDSMLFGNSPSNPVHNFHFTTEIHARFRYDASAGQVFRFVGDDDVWVFIGGRLVIDLSGTHSAQEQFVDLSRLGLVDGDTYSLDLFHAERQTNSSNFAFQTNVLLHDAPVNVTAAFD